ncbi:MAG: hypothetical protein E7324_08140 [Clostridiales bacterium]|nr:hypothetical protein [Clostridiales bacterium]
MDKRKGYGQGMKDGMKRLAMIAVLFFLSMFSALGDSVPPLPEDMLPIQDVQLPQGNKYPVYSGPGEEYHRAANGKASVSTNDWVQVFGSDKGWLLIRYGVNQGRTRFGYIQAPYETNGIRVDLGMLWEYGRGKTVKNTVLTDDPFESKAEVRAVRAGTEWRLLFSVDGWWYAETTAGEKLRGFIPSDALERIPVPYEKDADLVKAVSQLEATGIQFSVRGMDDQRLFFDLSQGGSLYYLDIFEFYPYDLREWYPENLSDADAEKYIEFYLKMAVQVEQGRAPEAHLQPNYHGELGKKNIEAVVSNLLSGLAGEFEQQGLGIVLDRLAAHDGDDAMNSMRARLASQILGKLDRTPVDPSQGCVWYDALTLARQDDLPPVDASVYEQDPLLCAASQALMDIYDQDYRGWRSQVDVDWGKSRCVVALKVFKTQKTGNSATLWANVSQACYVLYDGERAELVSGSWIPCRIEMKKGTDGAWTLKEIIQAEDGEEYAPSIRAFCNGDRKLAQRMMEEGYADTDGPFLQYLSFHGYDTAAIVE